MSGYDSRIKNISPRFNEKILRIMRIMEFQGSGWRFLNMTLTIYFQIWTTIYPIRIGTGKIWISYFLHNTYYYSITKL